MENELALRSFCLYNSTIPLAHACSEHDGTPGQKIPSKDYSRVGVVGVFANGCLYAAGVFTVTFFPDRFQDIRIKISNQCIIRLI